MTEWIVVNGHVLGQCAYLNSDDPDEPCDCRDLLDEGDGEDSARPVRFVPAPEDEGWTCGELTS